MVSLTQLEYIIAVDQFRHFGKAAKACNVSQPSLSIQLQKAEDLLGFSLFDRSKKPIIPTDEGLLFIKQSRVVLSEYDHLLSINSVDEVKGQFKLGIIPTLSSYITPLFISSFSKKYPDVELTIIEYQTEVIKEKLDSDQIDGAILVTPLNDTRFIESPLFLEPFYLFAGKEMKLALKVDPNSIDRSKLWLLSEGNCFRNQAINLCSKEKGGSPLPSVIFEGGSIETLIELVRKNGGYTIIPHLAVSNLSRSEKEKYIHEFKGKTPTREVSFIRSRSFMKESIINALMDEISDAIPKELTSFKGRHQILPID